MAGPERPPAAAVSRPLLQGRQWVSGLWFPAGHHGEMGQARRLLCAWRPGSSAWRFADGDLLRYPAAVWDDCDRLAGWPLRREGQGLCSAFLTEAERRRLPAADLWLVRGGELLALHLTHARPLDPSDWLDLGGPALHDTFDCRAALPPPVFLVPPVRTVREVLGVAIPPGRGPMPPEGHSGGLLWLPQELSVQARLAAAPTPPRTLETWLQQTTYLSELLRMLEEGRLDEVLRHALPLCSEALLPPGAAMGVPVPRTGLGLAHDPRGATGFLRVIPDLATRLRDLYWKAFEQLDREGRVEEAVFVRAELLGARHEALKYLEDRQRYALAAELAQAWHRPAEEIVRLHCLAGDWSRAVAVARRDAVFASVVLRMENDWRWPEAARRLRAEWGEALALQGDWLGAVKAVWPVQELRTQAQHWLQVAEAADGELGAQALVQRARLLPDTMDCHAGRLRALRDEGALHGERAALANALLAPAGRNKATQALAAAMTGAVLADHVQGQGWLSEDALRDLVNLGGNALLRADLPAAGWPQTRHQPLAERRSLLEGAAPERGAQALLDAVSLTDRRHLVALGESGVMIVDASGRPVTHFGVPAHRLVLASSRQQVLALARRDGVWRVSRLDLAQRRASDLGVCELDRFADRFDGLGWLVACGTRLRMLDTSRSVQDVLWQPPDLPSPVQALGSTSKLVRVVTDGSLWTYSLQQGGRPACEPLLDVPRPRSRRLLDPHRGVVTLVVHTSGSGGPRVAWQGLGKTGKMALPPGHGHEVQAETEGNWLVLVWQEAAAGQDQMWRIARWIDLSNGATRATVRWPVDGALRLRACGGQWLLFDDCGRLLRLDTASSELLQLAVQ